MPENHPHRHNKPALILWALAGLILWVAVVQLPQNRTQEARVLETAREMLGTGWHGWIVPYLNGRIRLEKPPLAYWLAAGSCKLFGVSVWAGRLPMALTAWLLLGLTYAMGRWLFNARAGLFSAGTLLSTYLFYRYAPLAETDTLSALFVTAAIYCIWRGSKSIDKQTRGHGDKQSERPSPCLRVPLSPCPSTFLWYHASAAATALAILSKGPPGVFPILFLLALALLERRWRILRDYLASGALVTLALIAAPWFLYVSRLPEWQIVKNEAAMVVTGGQDHRKPFWEYFKSLPVTTIPWIGFLLTALIAAIAAAFAPTPDTQKPAPDARDSNPDRAALRGLLLWAAIIFLCLTLAGQKQQHYLIQILPPLMLLVGWAMDRAIDRLDPRLTRSITLTLGGTASIGLLAAVVPVAAAAKLRGRVTGLDINFALLLAFLMLAVTVIFRLKGLRSALTMLAGSAALLMTLALSVWVPSLQTVRYEHAAAAIRRAFPDACFVFYVEENLPLVFRMRQPIPLCPTDRDLAAALSHTPRPVVIVDWKKDKAATRPIPPGLTELYQITMDDRVFSLYR